MTKYEVVIAGTVIATFATKEEANAKLEEARHSIFAMVHPSNCMFVRTKK